jgi:osmotically inducible lipoprotein OsmB
MNRTQSNSILLISCVVAVAMAGCGNLDRRERSTAAGAVVGGVAGAVLTDGSPGGAVAGAVVGGVVGNQVGKRH